MANVITEHITKNPDIYGGKACIAEHRVRVMDVAIMHEQRINQVVCCLR